MLRSMLSTLVLLVLVAVILAVLVRLGESRLAFFPFSGEDVTPADFGVRYEALDVHTADGERLRAWWMPHEAPRAQIVYFHGNGGNLSLWADILVPIHRRGFSVFAFDYRGYGRSSGSPSEAGLYRDVEAVVREVAERFGADGPPLVYWGRSLGGTMAAYGARQLAPAGLILEAGFPDVATLLAANPVLRFLSLFSSYRFSTRRWLADVRAPVLVMHGDADSIVPFEAGRALYTGISGDKRFFTVRGGDHNDASPADEEGYWGAVNGFIASLPRQPD